MKINEVSNSDGETPLTFAIKNNKVEIVKLLLANGANTDKLSEIDYFKLLCINENISATRGDELIEEIKDNRSCPITLEQFSDLNEPVLCTDGVVYEKAEIQTHWQRKGEHLSPLTRNQISIVSSDLNTVLKSLIDKFAKERATAEVAAAPSTARLKNKRTKKKKEKNTKKKKLRKEKNTKKKKKKDKKTKEKHKRQA